MPPTPATSAPSPARCKACQDSPLYRRVMNLPNGAPAGAFDGLSGETHSTSATMLQGAANTFVQVPMTRLRAT